MWRPFEDLLQDAPVCEVICPSDLDSDSDSESDLDVGIEDVLEVDLNLTEDINTRSYCRLPSVARNIIRNVFNGLRNSGHDIHQLYNFTAYLTAIPLTTVSKSKNTYIFQFYCFFLFAFHVFTTTAKYYFYVHIFVL